MARSQQKKGWRRRHVRSVCRGDYAAIDARRPYLPSTPAAPNSSGRLAGNGVGTVVIAIPEKAHQISSDAVPPGSGLPEPLPRPKSRVRVVEPEPLKELPPFALGAEINAACRCGAQYWRRWHGPVESWFIEVHLADIGHACR